MRKPRGASEARNRAELMRMEVCPIAADPGMDVRVGVIPPSEIVELEHAEQAQKETEEPEERSGVCGSADRAEQNAGSRSTVRSRAGRW